MTVLPFAQTSRAQPDWPSKPIKLIVPLAPGGTADSTARILAEQLSRRWGQPVVVDNRAGASGIIAMEALSRATPDGYTLGMGNLNTMVTNPFFHRKLPYDPVTSLRSITRLTTSPLFLIVNPKLPIHSLGEFIAYAKSNPGKLSYASIGSGSTMHLATAMLEQRTNIQLTHVPYKGMGAALQDLVSGNVQMAMDISAMSMVHAGKLRAIAVAAEQRYAGEPTIPSFGESGLHGFELVTFLSLHAPSGLPKILAERIYADVRSAFAVPEVAQRIQAMNLDVALTNPVQLDTFLAAERLRYFDVIQKAGIQSE